MLMMETPAKRPTPATLRFLQEIAAQYGEAEAFRLVVYFKDGTIKSIDGELAMEDVPAPRELVPAAPKQGRLL